MNEIEQAFRQGYVDELEKIGALRVPPSHPKDSTVSQFAPLSKISLKPSERASRYYNKTLQIPTTIKGMSSSPK